MNKKIKKGAQNMCTLYIEKESITDDMPTSGYGRFTK